MVCYIWYSEEWPGWAAAPPSPLLAVPNVTAHPSTASVPITVLLYNGPLLCGFNVAIEGLTFPCRVTAYDVHQHQNVVFDVCPAVIGDHRLVDDDQRLDESLAAD